MHNAEVDANRMDCHHLKPGPPLVIGEAIDELRKVIHLNITTQHMHLHVIRGINAGWAITVFGDGLYCLCRNEFGMVSLCIVGLYGETFPLCYSIVPKESISVYGKIWRGFVAATFYLFKRAKVL